MAKLYNMQPVQGVVLVPDGTLFYNNRPVIGLSSADPGLAFSDNRTVLGIELITDGSLLHNDLPVIGAVVISDGRTLYNNAPVIPASGLLTATAPAFLTGTPMEGLTLSVYPGSYSIAPDSITRQMEVSADGFSGWADLGAPLSGDSVTLTGVTFSGVTGKYLRLTETAVKDGASVATSSVAIGPVSAFVPLPSLPLAAGEKLWAIGDSHIGYSNYLGSPVGSGGNFANLAAMSTGYGFIEWAKAIDPRFSFDVWYDPDDPLGRNFQGANLGIFGDHLQPTGTVPGIVPRLPALAAKGPKIVLFEGGFNTIHSNDTGAKGTSAYVISQLDDSLSQLRQSGALVILLVPYPTTVWPDGDPRYQVLAEVQVWCRAQAGRDGVFLLDAGDILAPGGSVDATFFKSDRIHLAPKGALGVGKDAFLPLIRTLFAAGTSFNTDLTVANLLPASQANMDGTSGTKSGSPNIGNVPTGWLVTRGRNCAIVNSIDDYQTGKHRLNLAVTPGGSDNGEFFEISVSPPTVTIPTGEPTKWYQAWFRVEIDEMKDLTFIELLYGLYVGTGTIVHRSAGLGRESSGEYALGQIPGPLSLWLTSPAVTNQSANPAINGKRGFLRFTGRKAGAPLNIAISRPIVREVADPLTVWGF